ncbi:uncharacterized protein Bfra_000941 [Botrytis fragariae]|uniref:Uncharacterized protein n=1 Tax=Botrytis fragariae TaxID=1964551 RepID=A0A8H6B4A5_9HELO|nr:uncharacterized protein Bfra_000941 [Botrytis fragariae]KAF5878772.1 hypothetical protein Bfra_000941 [Botrytis fragariae]
MKDCGDFGMKSWESSEVDNTYISATSNCNIVFTLQEVVGHKHLCATRSPRYIVLGSIGSTRPRVSVSCTDGESFSEYTIYCGDILSKVAEQTLVDNKVSYCQLLFFWPIMCLALKGSISLLSILQ